MGGGRSEILASHNSRRANSSNRRQRTEQRCIVMNIEREAEEGPVCVCVGEREGTATRQSQRGQEIQRLRSRHSAATFSVHSFSKFCAWISDPYYRPPFPPPLRSARKQRHRRVRRTRATGGERRCGAALHNCGRVVVDGLRVDVPVRVVPGRDPWFVGAVLLAHCPHLLFLHVVRVLLVLRLLQ